VLSDNSRTRDIKSLFIFEKCNQKQTDTFLKFINDYRGNLSPRQLSLQLKTDTITIKNKIHILSMDEFLESELKIKSPLVFKKSKIVGEKIKSFGVNEFDDIQTLCEKCAEMGLHTYKVSIQKTNGVLKNFWVSSETVTQVKALVPLNSIVVDNNALHAKLFDWKTIYTSNPNLFFTDLSQITFFKLSRNVNKNIPLKRNALNFVNLVKAGQIATITMRHGGLSLKSKGIATRHGKIGDSVSLRNIKTKKIIMGKVIGESLVEVKL
jgi:flagella basal body P-ring formation protein FlgA